jgi:hypothetical protein
MDRHVLHVAFWPLEMGGRTPGHHSLRRTSRSPVDGFDQINVNHCPFHGDIPPLPLLLWVSELETPLI